MQHEKGRPSEAANPNSVRSGHAKSTPPLTPDDGPPPTLLDVLDQVQRENAGAAAAGSDGQRQAVHGEDVRIVAALEDEVRRLAGTGVEFTADDVLPELASRKALGGIFSTLARAGLIRCVGATSSTRRERHGALTRVWIGAGVRDAR